MAISIVAQPAAVGLARNQMWLALETDNYLTAGTKASLELVFTGNPSAGQEITIGWEALDLLAGQFTFDFVATYTLDNSGLQLPTNVNSDALLTYINTYLVPALRSNYYISRDYDISVSGTTTVTVTLTAKEKKSIDYDFDPTSENVSNMTFGTNTPGVSDGTKDSFQFLVLVYVEKVFLSGTYELILELVGEPDGDERAEWDIAEDLLAHLEADVPVIGNGITQCTGILKRYYFRYAENYADNPGATQVVRFLYNTTLTSSRVLMAGVKFDSFPGNTFLADYVTATADRKFLTNQPRSKSVSKSEKNWLYFLCSETDAALRVYVKIYYDDLSNETQEIFSVSSPEYAPYLFPTGYDQLDLGSYTPAKTVESWEIWVEKNIAGRRSEIFTYELDNTAYPHTRNLLFLNSLGGMDTICCTGEQTEEIALEPNLNERTVPRGYAAQDAQIFEDPNQYHDIITVSTGYKDEEYIKYLRDLMQSNEAYEITDSGLRRIVLDRDKIALFDTEDNLHGLEISYRYAFNNTAHSE